MKHTLFLDRQMSGCCIAQSDVRQLLRSPFFPFMKAGPPRKILTSHRF